MPKVIIVKRKNSQEFINLVKSLGYEIVDIVEFKEGNNPRFYITKGKVSEIKDMIDEVDRVIIDGLLKSSQWYNLEKELGVEVNDKIKLIIDIFADRARSREAMLQIEYARLKYEIPYVKEMIHHIRAGEHAGWMGGGEYEVSDYYEMIKKRMSRIKKKLEKMRIHREERRKMRRRRGYILVGIAGYTNSGKSTLLNSLTHSNMIVEDRMFSTLSTKTSKLGRERILITDTVGFVEDMPPWLIGSFEATLEEIYNGDVVLLLLDGSDSIEEFERKMKVSIDILGGKVKGKVIPVIAKIDIADELDEKMQLVSEIGEAVFVSAKTGEGIDNLIKRIKREAGLKRFEILTKSQIDSVLNYIRDYGKIEYLEIGDYLHVKFLMSEKFVNNLRILINDFSSGNDGVLREI